MTTMSLNSPLSSLLFHSLWFSYTKISQYVFPPSYQNRRVCIQKSTFLCEQFLKLGPYSPLSKYPVCVAVAQSCPTILERKLSLKTVRTVLSTFKIHWKAIQLIDQQAKIRDVMETHGKQALIVS